MARSDAGSATSTYRNVGRTNPRSHWVGISSRRMHRQIVEDRTGRVLESLQITAFEPTLDDCIVNSFNDDGMGHVELSQQSPARVRGK